MSISRNAWKQVSSNIFKTWLIMGFFSIFAVGVIYVIARGLGLSQPGGLGTVGFALVLAGTMNFISYFWSDKIILAVSRAKQIERKDHMDLYSMVERLCRSANLPLPKIYLSDDSSPNAFATGRSPEHASICFTKGIMEELSDKELEGVAAHELSHVGNRDTLLMAVVAVLVGTIAILADWFRYSLWFGGRSDDREGGNGNQLAFIIALAASILAPIAAMLIQLAISRKRELLADASGAILTRNPEELAQALIKISSDKRPLTTASTGTAHLYIVNPFKGKSLTNLFSTHPPVEVRVKALRAMERI